MIEEVAYRTPGFSGWQQERWWTHCGDAGQFLGRAGRKELEAFGPEAITAIQDSTGLDAGPEWDRFLHHAEIITITGRSYRLKDRAKQDNERINGEKPRFQGKTNSKKEEKPKKKTKTVCQRQQK